MSAHVRRVQREMDPLQSVRAAVERVRCAAKREQAKLVSQLRARVTREATCPCGGTGRVYPVDAVPTRSEPCPACKGAKFHVAILVERPAPAQATCDQCNGRGTINTSDGYGPITLPCSACKGGQR